MDSKDKTQPASTLRQRVGPPRLTFQPRGSPLLRDAVLIGGAALGRIVADFGSVGRG